MRVELGKGYTNEDVLAVFATVLLDDYEVDSCIVMDAEAKDSGLIDERGMNASAVVAAVDGLKNLGMTLEEVIALATHAYENGGNDEPLRTRV